jgi:hypothetical protein
MSAARPVPAIDADFDEIGDERRTDRRRSDRRAPRLSLDLLFAVTLVDQIARKETTQTNGYGQSWRGPRAGIIVNVQA